MTKSNRAGAIPVTSAWAEAVTPLAAFDAALLAAGVGDVNLVALSSIVPPDFDVIPTNAAQVSDYVPLGWGNLTFCVMAEQRAISGSVAAGLAWVVDTTGAGGLFLEAHGTDAEEVRAELAAGVQAMMASRPALHFGEPIYEVVAGSSSGPSSAVVVAVFESRPF